MKKMLFIILGSLTFALGTIGIFFPVLPTTPFYLLTAFLWLNSSERLHNYFVGTTYYQKYIQEMIFEKKMSKRDQVKMFIGILFILAIPFFIVDSWIVKVILLIVYVSHLILLTRYFNKPVKVSASEND